VSISSEPAGADVPQDQGVPVLVTDLASRTLAVKEGDLFLYSDTQGNLSDDHRDFGLGFYYKDTRFLSHFTMKIAGRDPVLLSSSAERAYMSHVDLTNPDLYEWGVLSVPQQTLNIRRIRAINGRLYERVRVKNYNSHPTTLDVEFTFGADYADIFEVRGMVAGQARIVVEHVTRLRDDLAPDWPQPSGAGGYRVVLEGSPNYTLDLQMLGEDGDHNTAGLLGTAMRVLNAIPAVCEAPPGMLSVLDLAIVPGRHLLG